MSSDFELVIICIICSLKICLFCYYLLFIIITTCWDGNCTNQEDLDQETFEMSAEDIPPSHLHLAAFNHNLLSQGFTNSDSPPSYENCVLEPKPPSYSTINIDSIS